MHVFYGTNNIFIEDDLTAGAFWFYMNTTYFPHNMFEILSDTSEEEFIRQI